MREYRTGKIDFASVEYPEKLRNIPGPPKQLYYAGDISLLHRKCAGVVGARKYTVYGKNVALMTGRRLAESGIPVVSGLALGIDAFSHEGALEAGGKVIGVLGSGINRMGPARNRDLMMRGLSAGGLVVSEYGPDEEASGWTFPARNRIISGLSEAVIVIEAGFNSGSLITAKHAADQGRTIYAVPGNINSQSSIGCNLLIRDGAVPLVVIDDLLRDLGAASGPKDGPPPALEGDELLVYEAAAKMSGATCEELIGSTGLAPSLLNSILTVMEIKGLIESYAGRIYISR